MALTINGTTGISGVDGSASAPAITGTDSNTGFSFGSDFLNINTGGTKRVKIESNGRVGIGEGTPASSLHISGSDATARLIVQRGANQGQFGVAADGATVIDAQGTDGTDGHFAFYAENEKKFAIASNGSFKFHQDSTNSPGVNNSTHGGSLTESTIGTALFLSKDAIVLHLNRNNTGEIVKFRRNGTTKGNIHINASRVAYNTTSDYRLKENAVAISDGITRLKTLKPYKFNFKDDPTNTLDGFFAHEVTAVAEAVTGTKDAVAVQADIDEGLATVIGEPIYQSLDQSKLVPLLTAALQEAVGKIETLETKVAALEAA